MSIPENTRLQLTLPGQWLWHSGKARTIMIERSWVRIPSGTELISLSFSCLFLNQSLNVMHHYYDWFFIKKSCEWQMKLFSNIFIIYFPNSVLTSMFASLMAQLGFFLYSYAATGNWTHVNSVAPLLRDLNPMTLYQLSHQRPHLIT